MARRTTYFDYEGNYGDATDLIIYDSTEWTADDYATLDWASQSERRAVAQAINVYHQQQRADGGKSERSN